MKKMKGFVLKKLATNKAVRLTLIAILLAVTAIFLSGCTAGQVVAPFNPKEVKPEPYTPEPEWSERTDVTLTSIESMKKQSGQTVAPGATTSTGITSGTSTSTGTTPGTTPGTSPGQPTIPPTPVPGPSPTPPAPTGRKWSPSDPVYGWVRDRVEGGLISGATVVLADGYNRVVAQYVTSSDGGYSFVSLKTGYYKLSVMANGYMAIPLTNYNFYFDGSTPIIHNLEMLGVGMPTLLLAGGDFYGPSIYTYGNVMAIHQYIASQQKTYWGALFESTTPSASFYAQAFYQFFLPAPKENDYDYDGVWLTTEQFKPADTGGWGAAEKTDFRRVYYNWGNWGTKFPSGWYRVDTETDYIPFWAIKRDTDGSGKAGEVRIALAPVNTPKILLTSVQLTYDYHKDMKYPDDSGHVTTDPPKLITDMLGINEYPINNNPAISPYDLGSINSVGTFFALSEDAYITMDVYRMVGAAPGPGDVHIVNSQEWPWMAGISVFEWYYLDPVPDWTEDNYYYYIKGTDQAGNTSQTYGPFFVRQLEPNFSGLAKGVDGADIYRGQVINYSITITNNTDAPAYVTIIDTLPFLENVYSTSFVQGSAYLSGQRVVPDPLGVDSSGNPAIRLDKFLALANSTAVLSFDLISAPATGLPSTTVYTVINRVDAYDRRGNWYWDSVSKTVLPSAPAPP